MPPAQDLPIVQFESAAEWERWLAEHHDTSPGLWLKLAKAASGVSSVTYSEAVEVALCFGWIDGQVRRLDEQFRLQRFTRRTPRSKWSKINRAKATALIESGRMHPAGLRAIEQAQGDGRWYAAYDSPSTATVPEDLQQALDANEAARTFWSTLNRTNRYAILYSIQDAKRPETRARRIEKFVAMLAEGKKLY